MHVPDSQRARTLIAGFPGQSIVVIGDVMLDHFLFGHVTRISPEAPVPVVHFDREEYRLGGAGNVAHTVKALGGDVRLLGVVGADESGDRLIECAAALGMGTHDLLRDDMRLTTTKLRVVTDRRQQVARVDFETDADISPTIEDELAARLSRAAKGASVIVVSDYLKGAVTQTLVSRAIALGETSGIAVLVDPKIAHLGFYAGATLVTPNHAEAEIATHLRIRTDEEARAAAHAFCAQARCRSVLITRGELGMWLLERSAIEGPAEPSILTDAPLTAAAREVSDVTGAGDTVIGTIGLALAAGASLPEAAHLANHAAGVVVGKFGPVAITAGELIEAVIDRRAEV